MLQGILITVVLSLLDVARRSWQPHTAELVRVLGTDTFRDSDHVEGDEVIPGLVIYGFDAPLFFANATVMSKETAPMVASQGTPVEMVLFDAESVHDVDPTAVQVLEDLAGEGITLTIARLHTAVRETLDVAGLIDRIGEENIYLEVDDGVGAYLEHRDGR